MNGNFFFISAVLGITELVDDSDIEEVVESQFVPQPPLYNWRTMTVSDFAFEIMVVSLIILYLVVYFRGKAENERIARKWIAANATSFENECAVVGDKGKKLIVDGPRDYIFYASGREYIQHMYGFLALKPRHDLIGQLFDYVLGTTSYDKVTLDVTLNAEETDSFVFGIVPRSKASHITKNRWDLDQFTKPRDVQGIPKEDYVLLTENHEVTGPIVALDSCRKALLKSLGYDEQGT
jgi:hypothetical protein